MNSAAEDVGLKGCAGSILIVDDNPVNRDSLRWLLEMAGHTVRDAENGRKALEAVSEEAADLVIMDVKMPEMDGFEACRRLKQDAATSHIPVLLLTGLRDRESRLRGMEAGANDFLSKPPDEEELKLRVRNALFAKKLYDKVREQYSHLRQLENLRDSLTHMIVHDLRSPAAAAQGYLEIFQDTRGQPDTTSDATSLDPCIPRAHACIARLLEMIGSVLDVSRLESNRMQLERVPCDLRDVVSGGIELAGGEMKHIDVRRDFPREAVQVCVDREVIRRVVTNLVSNAVKFTPSNGTVCVAVRTAGSGARIEVTDAGPGIAPEYHESIFEKFGQVEPRSEGRVGSTGLGLTFCKLAVEAHGGRIGVESRPGEGSKFRVEIECVPGDRA